MKKKLTFFTLGEDTFLRDIIINLRKDYNIKFFQRGNPEEFYHYLHDTDIAWFEWCEQLPIEYTKHPPMCKSICRLHSYELFTPYPANVDWNKIDKLVFVSDIIKDFTLKKFKIRPDIATVIQNGVNLDKFILPENKTYNKKIAFIGGINYKKGPELLIQVFKKIWDYDNNFEFHIAGEMQDERIAIYLHNILQKLPFKIFFDGQVKDMPNYLKDKDYVISTSLFESFQYSIAEGMASGVMPLIHSWVGSEKIYPQSMLFTFPEEAVDIIKDYEFLEDKHAFQKEMRQYIIDNYSLEKQMTKIRELLKSLE